MVSPKMKEALKNESQNDTKPAPKDWAGVVIEKIAASKKLQVALVLFVAVLLIALGLRIYNNLKGPEGTAKNQAVLTVSVVEASQMKLNRHLKLTGTIWAKDPLTVGSEIGGLKIETIKVEEGDFVKKGQVLATLNSNLLKAQLEREKARQIRAQANLEKTIQPNRPMDIAKLEFAISRATALILQEKANIVRAEANLNNAKQNTIRYRQLRAQGAVSQEDLDSRETTEDTMEADLANAKEKLKAAQFAKRQARENLKLANEGGSTEDVGMAKADLLESTANVKHIQAQIAQTTIRAPEKGWITKRHCHIGDISSMNQPFFEMVKNNRFEVRAEIPEDDLSFLSKGQKVIFTSISKPDAVLVGSVRETSPLIDRDTRLAMVRIDIPFDHKTWKPGMFVSGQVELGSMSTLAVPSKSVIDRDGRKIVFILNNSPEEKTVDARTVSVGEQSNNYIEIKDGVKEGELVVVSGAGFLKDGDIVRVGQETEK